MTAISVSHLSQSNCSACGARLTWVKTAASGRFMPCEGALVTWSPELGKITLITESGDVVTKPYEGIAGYRPHWGNCPKANEFRKKK